MPARQTALRIDVQDGDAPVHGQRRREVRGQGRLAGAALLLRDRDHKGHGTRLHRWNAIRGPEAAIRRQTLIGVAICPVRPRREVQPSGFEIDPLATSPRHGSRRSGTHGFTVDNKGKSWIARLRGP